MKLSIAASLTASLLLLFACGGGGGNSWQPAMERILANADSEIDTVTVRDDFGSGEITESFDGPTSVERGSLLPEDGVRLPASFESRGTRRGIALGEWSEDGTSVIGRLQHSFFVVDHDPYFGPVGLAAFGADSTGAATASNPTFPSATWSGVVVGFTRTTVNLLEIEGDATLTLDFGGGAQSGTPVIDVEFTRLRDTAFGDEWPDMTWTGLAVRDGTFQDASLRGQFYGPNHEEVGGVFNRNHIVGAFGARQQ